MIQGRLFWKILFGFWLTFLLISQLLWLGFTLYDGGHRAPPEEAMIQRVMSLQMSMGEAALTRGGETALHALIAQWPTSEQGFLSVTQGSGDSTLPKGPPAWDDTVMRMPPPP